MDTELLKDKVAIVYDEGMFMCLAERLSRDFKKVYFYSPWKSEYPVSQDDMIGEGVPGIERISDFWAVVDDVNNKYNIDIYIFPSIYNGDIQNHLVSLGKRVWGSRNGDELERFRLQANSEFEKLGLPRPTMTPVIGIDALKKHLKPLEDKYIKISNYRGDFETKHYENYELFENWLAEREFELAQQGKEYEFIVEDPIVAEEFGYDGYCIDGEYPDTTLFGLEQKDCGYIGHVKPYKEISPLITDFNEKIKPIMKLYKYRNFFSTEQRITDEKVSYEIDFTARFPAPPGELLIEIISNISEIIWFGAGGIMIQPEFEAEYGIEIMINSESAPNRWQAVYYPEEIDRWIKLRHKTVIKGVKCVIPKYRDFSNIGALVAIGGSIEECIDKAKKYADMIKGDGVDVKIGAIDKMLETIKRGKKLGISF